MNVRISTQFQNEVYRSLAAGLRENFGVIIRRPEISYHDALAAQPNFQGRVDDIDLRHENRRPPAEQSFGLFRDFRNC